MSEIVVARQPIFDRKLEVHAYELLFRGTADADAASFEDGDLATASVLLHTLLDIGTERVVGRHRALVKCTRAFLVGDRLLSLSPDKFVLQVLQGIEPDEAVLQGMRALREEGFTIALGDADLDGMEPLLELADIVKLDCRAAGAESAARRVARLRSFGVEVIAEKVQTHEELEACRNLGVDYFQGYFLSRPQTIRGRKIPANELAMMRVLAEVNDPDAGVDELAAAIQGDVGLSYALVRLANSVLHALPRRVERMQDVIMVLGLHRIRALSSLLLLTQIEEKPKELFRIALVRGRMCELLADVGGLPASAFFTTGLFSTLEALLDTPLETILTELPLAEEIEDALLGTRKSPLWRCLDTVLAYERGDWKAVDCSALPLADVGSAYLQAVDFANGLDLELTQPEQA